MMKLSSTDAAYIAGFIDGEGSFQIMKRFHRYSEYPAYTAYIDIGNTNREVLEWISQKVKEVTIHERNLKTNPKWGVRKPAYYLRFNFQTSKELSRFVLPYLKIEKRQAEIFLEFPEPRFKEPRELREQLWLEIKTLNQRGILTSAETLQKTSK